MQRSLGQRQRDSEPRVLEGLRAGINHAAAWLRPAPGRRRLAAALALAVALGAPGCAHVPAYQQRLVSKPNMQFSDSLVFGYQHKLVPQVEPGSAFSGGPQSSGCTSCK